MYDKEKLILLIKNREPLYNFKLKDHSNKNVLKKLWEEIAIEMGLTATVCKLKWTSLRNSYARYVRSEYTNPTENRKEWYLANAMSFLRENMAYHRYTETVLQQFDEEESSSSSNHNSMDYNIEAANSTIEEHFISMEAEDLEDVEGDDVCENNQITAHESLTETTVEYLPNTIISPRKVEKQPELDPNLLFFKALLPDINKLTEKNQRKLKQGFLFNLNKTLDEQEKE